VQWSTYTMGHGSLLRLLMVLSTLMIPEISLKQKSEYSIIFFVEPRVACHFSPLSTETAHFPTLSHEQPTSVLCDLPEGTRHSKFKFTLWGPQAKFLISSCAL
jgi:hypothetical protein